MSTRNRTGKATKDIFSKTTGAPSRKPPKDTPAEKQVPEPDAETAAAAKEPRGRGRPAVHAEAWSKVTTVLFNRQIVFLDRLGVDIREQSGKGMNRTEIIRALIDALEGSGLEVTAVQSEAELRDLVTARLQQ